jgi:nucleotide-binding universal stress UspA family protein
MISTILVTLDTSELGEAVLPYVETIATVLNSSITLFNAVDLSSLWWYGQSEEGDGFGDQSVLDEFQSDAKEKARRYLDEKANQLKELGLSVTTAIESGNSSEAILDYIKLHAPGLVAMSTHGRSGFGRFLLGSVAGRVIRHARCPLLIVRPQEDTPKSIAKLTDIVVPLDQSKHSEAVLPIARELAQQINLRMTLVMVVPTASDVEVDTEVVIHKPTILDRLVDTADEYIKNIAATISIEDGLEVRSAVLRGDAGNAIVDYAREQFQNNIIAMSTHGRSGIGRWLLGSVTDKVVRSSGDPVLIICPDAQ